MKLELSFFYVRIFTSTNVEDEMDAVYRLLVIRPMMFWQEWLCARAKAYLLTHDASYRTLYIQTEVMRRREKLYSEGVSPTDVRIPDRWSIESKLPPMSWPYN